MPPKPEGSARIVPACHGEHVEELRAKLRGYLDRIERQQIPAELGAAFAERARRREVPPR